MKKPQAILDIESFPNYFLISFMRCEDEFIVSYDFSGENKLDPRTILNIMDKYEVITFNGRFYDIPMLRLALSGASSQLLKKASDTLISDGMKLSDFESEFELKYSSIDYIDIIEVAPLDGSLKLYMGRLHSRKLQELPYEHNRILTNEEMKKVKEYCANDLRGTKELAEALNGQIELRRSMSERYNQNFLSKSDSQIAEMIIKAEVTKKTGKRIGKATKYSEFKYQLPPFVRIVHEDIYEALEEPFMINGAGRIDMPKKLAELKIHMGHSVYQMGMGGLHSTEKQSNHKTDAHNIVCDFDVASYYPSIILNCGLYPQQIGPPFLEVYRELVETRLAGKRAKNMVIADSLRIAINGSFGKLGSPYSVLYAPDLMIQVTLTGQLCLLMLIHALEKANIPVVSGNTDGIVVRCPRNQEDLMVWLIDEWMEETGFVMERTDYSGIYSRDVNNYIALKQDGKVKTKGCFSTGGLSKNPQNEICNIALVEYLKNGTKFEDTIRACNDITKFVTVRTVKGGAVWKGQQIGKVVRWYQATDQRQAIHYVTSKNMVPRTMGARPCQELPEQFPKDVDYGWYIRECNSMLEAIGMRGPHGQQSLF